ncbi:MAG: hypothetical protein MJ104_09620 [Lachnospiraceae bacterium]|nr:hypothetical protein [Lachnospiraceae bacterium]
MITFINLPPFIQSVIGVYAVILFLLSTAGIATGIMHKHVKVVIISAPICVLLYLLDQAIFDIISGTYVLGRFRNAEKALEEVSFIYLLVILVVITVIELGIFWYNRKWTDNNITARSIKEAIDNLPIGVCCYEPNGQIVLKNHQVEKICREYTGEPLLNAVTFLYEITAGSRQIEKDNIIKLKNGSVYAFNDRVMKEKDDNLRMLSIVDITEQYQNTKTLEEKQRTVSKLNEELILYGKQIVASIAAKEILDAKVKIHDELGANLLASKRYILTGGTEAERATIETVLRNNLQYLKQETEITPTDELALILDTAQKLEIKMNILGKMTDLEPQRHIIVTGMHECLTNTIRHARGDELTIRLEETDNEIMAEFTNNGNAPDKEINERGGLALLRSLTEKNGGTMRIDSAPRFVLTLRLKK